MSYLQAAQLQSNHLVQFFIRYLPNEQSSVWGVCDPSPVQGGQKSQLTLVVMKILEKEGRNILETLPIHIRCLQTNACRWNCLVVSSAAALVHFRIRLSIPRKGHLWVSVCFHQFFPQARGSRREAVDECCVQGARKGCGPFIMRQTLSYL